MTTTQSIFDPAQPLDDDVKDFMHQAVRTVHGLTEFARGEDDVPMPHEHVVTRRLASIFREIWKLALPEFDASDRWAHELAHHPETVAYWTGLSCATTIPGDDLHGTVADNEGEFPVGWRVIVTTGGNDVHATVVSWDRWKQDNPRAKLPRADKYVPYLADHASVSTYQKRPLVRPLSLPGDEQQTHEEMIDALIDKTHDQPDEQMRDRLRLALLHALEDNDAPGLVVPDMPDDEGTCDTCGRRDVLVPDGDEDNGAMICQDCADEQVARPAEDDWMVFNEGCKWRAMQVGGSATSAGRIAQSGYESKDDLLVALNERMERDGFWPNVWEQQERGDATLIHLDHEVEVITQTRNLAFATDEVAVRETELMEALCTVGKAAQPTLLIHAYREAVEHAATVQRQRGEAVVALAEVSRAS